MMRSYATSISAVVLVVLGAVAAAPVETARAAPVAGRLEIIATGIARPLELAITGRTLIVLAQGGRGAVAGEIHRLALDGDLPVDLTGRPRQRLAYVDGMTVADVLGHVHEILAQLDGYEEGKQIPRSPSAYFSETQAFPNEVILRHRKNEAGAESPRPGVHRNAEPPGARRAAQVASGSDAVVLIEAR
ncbi:MAG: hypothetical protein HY216_12685 [Candidatus Rokubacteria bacterium]|nr:hypothetical protein [Candidatus Rokubacteria bacterium]